MVLAELFESTHPEISKLPTPLLPLVCKLPGTISDCFPCLISIGMNTLVNYDLVPEPKIIDAALRACRRLNDFASAVRILEAIKVSETM